MKPANQWRPKHPVSKGASGYHEAVCHAAYYNEILDELIDIVKPWANRRKVIVDFGAGTGVSSGKLRDALSNEQDLWLVDNSPAWLSKAHEALGQEENVSFSIIEKTEAGYQTLADTIGSESADVVVSANTVHLISDLDEAFTGIAKGLKPGGEFIFESVNIERETAPKGAILLDDTVRRVHDIAIDLIRKEERYAKYKDGVEKDVEKTEHQRNFIFPQPRKMDAYLRSLRQAGFSCMDVQYRLFKVDYDDWLSFLRVKRLQAGILPEIGGDSPSAEEEKDRDELVTRATKMLFEELERDNELADDKGFTIHGVYVVSRRRDQRKGSLAGKNALVTGSSRGIGRSIAIACASEGANVIVNYNSSKDRAMEVMEAVKGICPKGDHIALKGSVAKEEEVRALFQEITKSTKKIDLLVNNAGIIEDKLLAKMEPDTWERVIETNLGGVYRVTRESLRLMPGGGRVVMIGSIIGLDGNFGQTNYAASKAGIVGFSKSLSKEVAKKGITVNVIAPGLVQSEILDNTPAERKKEILEMIPLKRGAHPAEIADIVLFLASEQSAYITGQVLRADGGMKM